MKFGTSHIKRTIAAAAETVEHVQTSADSGYGDWEKGGTVDRALLGAINQLRHAAEELEAERLESIYGVKQVL
jgi:hypothetical protein